jgi:hypothetical protein
MWRQTTGTLPKAARCTLYESAGAIPSARNFFTSVQSRNSAVRLDSRCIDGASSLRSSESARTGDAHFRMYKCTTDCAEFFAHTPQRHQHVTTDEGLEVYPSNDASQLSVTAMYQYGKSSLGAGRVGLHAVLIGLAHYSMTSSTLSGLRGTFLFQPPWASKISPTALLTANKRLS